MATVAVQRAAPRGLVPELPERALRFPQLRFMGSKFRLLPWVHEVLSDLEFDSALDAFAGSGAVAYLLKTMGKQVTANDFLNLSATIARAVDENEHEVLTSADLDWLCARRRAPGKHFIEQTFRGIFYTLDDLRFLDRLWCNLPGLRSPYKRALALSAAIRGCIKRQPRGVFTVAGDPEHYKDGRRDLRLSLEEHFREQAVIYNRCVFANDRENRVVRGDVFDLPDVPCDLVYLDPPYVPRADDNCYIKRYHFIEGLSCYWRGLPIVADTAVRKIAKRYTPFSYRKDCIGAFDRLFARFRGSILVLSYSSNGYPDLDILTGLMRQYKRSVVVHERSHRYHFGTHHRVAETRAVVTEYLVVGS
jgi:DNA adenine methylase/adenine-specific DNA-methyltransferase